LDLTLPVTPRSKHKRLDVTQQEPKYSIALHSDIHNYFDYRLRNTGHGRNQEVNPSLDIFYMATSFRSVQAHTVVGSQQASGGYIINYFSESKYFGYINGVLDNADIFSLGKLDARLPSIAPKPIPRVIRVKCETCPKYFESQDAANAHMADTRHRKPNIPCQTCARKFSSREAVNQHMEALNHFKKASSRK
jgi:hypothetical protein